MSSPSRNDPCEVADEQFDLPDVALPRVISHERVRGAGVLMLAHLYGTRLRFFDAVDRARTLLDTDQLCITDDDLLDRLYCWPERYDRYPVGPLPRAQLAAKILGIGHADVPEDARDQTIQRLLGRLLDALNRVCDPGVLRNKPTAADIRLLQSAAAAVQSRLSSSMTGLVTLQVRDLQKQLATATDILTALKDELKVPCRPDGGGPDIWGAVSVLVGDQLRADGIELFEAADQAKAWRVIFDWLDGYAGGVPTKDELCQAAALLQPPRRVCQPDPERPS